MCNFILTTSLGWFPANIAINDIPLKLDTLGYISLAECIGVSDFGTNRKLVSDFLSVINVENYRCFDF